MSRTVKTALAVVAALVLLVATILIFVVSNLDSIVATSIEQVGSRVIGATVKVDGVRINLSEGQGEIKGLSVANPRGFGDGKALSLDRIALQLDLAQTSSELVHVRSAVVDGARVNAVQGPAGNNLQALLDNIRASGSGSGSGNSNGQQDGSPKLIIDEFRFENALLTLSVPALQSERNAKIPDVVVRNIGRNSSGVTAAQAARQLLEPLVQSSLEAATGVSGAALRKRAEQEADSAIAEGQRRLTDKLSERFGSGKP